MQATFVVDNATTLMIIKVKGHNIFLSLASANINLINFKCKVKGRKRILTSEEKVKAVLGWRCLMAKFY